MTSCFFEKRILLVDDDDRHLISLRRILCDYYEVITVGSPIEALKLIDSPNAFPVIISDYRMPFMNGVEFFTRVRAIDDNIQRIMLTGYADLQMTIDAVNYCKINAFLTKPVSPVAVRRAVEDAFATYERLTCLDENDNATLNEDDVVIDKITQKEREIILLLDQGLSNGEIAKNMDITVGTVKSHMNNLFDKLGVHTRSKVVAKARQAGIIKSLRTTP